MSSTCVIIKVFLHTLKELALVICQWHFCSITEREFGFTKCFLSSKANSRGGTQGPPWSVMEILTELVAPHRLKGVEEVIIYETMLLNDYVQLCHINAFYYGNMYLLPMPKQRHKHQTPQCAVYFFNEKCWPSYSCSSEVLNKVNSISPFPNGLITIPGEAANSSPGLQSHCSWNSPITTQPSWLL